MTRALSSADLSQDREGSRASQSEGQQPRDTLTPGPWHYVAKLTASENHKGYRVFDAESGYIAEVSPRDEDGVEGGANARVIALAPVLLHCLRQIITDLPHKRDWLDPAIERIARITIANADGK